MNNIILLKKSFAFFLSLCLFPVLTACQKTPDETLVVQKNQDRLASAAAEPAADENTLKTIKETAPENYTYSYGTENDPLYITADAPVILPKADSLPSFKISSGCLSQEMVTGIFNYLFQGKKAYTTTGTDFTKEACQKLILQLKQNLAEVQASDEIEEADKESAIQQIQSSISDYEKQYDQLPEQSTLKTVETDSTLFKNDFSDPGISDEYYLDCTSDDGSWFYVSSNSADQPGDSSIIYSLGSSDINYSSQGDSIPVTEEQARSEKADSIGITFDDARKKADELLDSAGVDASLVQIYLKLGFTEEGDSHNPWLDDSRIIHQNEYSAFRFLYTRMIGNTETACTSMSYIIDSGENSYSTRWNYETIEILVSKNGIEALHWESPIETDEQISANTKIMAFKDAASIFEKMAPGIYQGRLESVTTDEYQPEYNVKVTSVKLCLMRVRDSGSQRTGLLIPAWVFYGEWSEKQHTETGDNYMLEEVPYILLAVNAVDGTVINPMEGY